MKPFTIRPSDLLGMASILMLICTANVGGHVRPAKRFETGLLAEGLPSWLEKRTYGGDVQNGNLENYRLDDNGMDDVISAVMEENDQRRLDDMRRILGSEYHADTKSYEPLDRNLRAYPNPSASVGFANGLRSYNHWKPALIGSVSAVVGVMAVVVAATLYQKRKSSKLKSAEDDMFIGLTKENLSGGGSGKLAPGGDLEGDRKLAQSAQMYHYQHQKQQMLALEKTSDHARASEDESEEDIEEGDFTVYECSGVAQTGEIEVKNPLFDEDLTNKQANTSGSSGELINCSDLEDTSDSTPTEKTVGKAQPSSRI